MEHSKNVFSILLKACLLTFCFVGIWQNISAAHKLDLTDNCLKIYDIGQQQSDGSPFRVDKGQKIPDKIEIGELALTYQGAGAESKLLTILNSKNDTIFSSNCKNGIMPFEFAGGVRFYIDPNEEYTFSHGDKTWTLKINENANAQTNDAVDSPSNETSNPASDNTNKLQRLLIVFLCVIDAIAIAILLFFCYKKGLFIFKKPDSKKENKDKEDKGDNDKKDNKNKKGKKDKKDKKGKKNKEDYKESTDESVVEDVPSNVQNTDSSGENKGAHENTSEDKLQEVLNRLLPEHAELSIEEKVTSLEQKLKSGENAKNNLVTVKKELSLLEDSPLQQVDDKIKELDQKECAPTEDKSSELREEIIGGIIKTIEKKYDSFRSLLDKAKNKNKGEKNPNNNILFSFFHSVNEQFQDKSPSAHNTTNVVEYFDHHLRNNASCWPKVTDWVIDQIEQKDFKGLPKNLSRDDLFRRIAECLKKADEIKNQPPLDGSVAGAIKDDELTEKQKKTALRWFVENINHTIGDSSAQLDANKEDPIKKIAAALQAYSSQKDVENEVPKNNLNTEAEDKVDSKSDTDVLNLKEIDNLLNEYKVSHVSELPDTILEKQKTDIFNNVKKYVNDLLPEQHPDTVQDLVNELIKIAKEAKDSKGHIADQLERKIKGLDSEYAAPKEKDVKELLEKYDRLVSDKERTLKDDILTKNGQISAKDRQINELNKSLEEKKKEISELSAENSDLMLESSSLVDKLHNGADRITENCKTILHPCSDNDESQCELIEDRLFGELNSTVSAFKAFSVANDEKPVVTRKRIQKLLADELSIENNPINTVCRYYAYSRLPFMTDTSREYGITFNRKNMSELFNSIDSLYVQFGINLNIPDLFVAGFEEGNFENLTGQTYGDLDNLCQNSRNHFDKIDSNAKPEKVLIDIVKVGFSIDGEVKEHTGVLTF